MMVLVNSYHVQDVQVPQLVTMMKQQSILAILVRTQTLVTIVLATVLMTLT